MVLWKKLFNRRIVSVGQPMPEHRIIDPKEGRDALVGYTVTVEYEDREERRFFAIKKATKKLGDYMARDAAAKKRALEYMGEMREKIKPKRQQRA